MENMILFLKYLQVMQAEVWKKTQVVVRKSLNHKFPISTSNFSCFYNTGNGLVILKT